MSKQEYSSSSHNVCYEVPHITVSYWIQLERGNYPLTDLVGEFAIIDPSFFLCTYGNYLTSRRNRVREYCICRSFVEFEKFLPPSADGYFHRFSVLRCHLPHDGNGDTVFFCRCYFDDPSLQTIDFQISLNISGVKTNNN